MVKVSGARPRRTVSFQDKEIIERGAVCATVNSRVVANAQVQQFQG